MKKFSVSKILQVLLIVMILVIVMLLVVDILQNVSKNERITEIVLITFLTLSFFIMGLITFTIYWIKFKTTNTVISSMNSIGSSQEEFFNVGSIIYNSDDKISFISPWLLKEGMNKFLGMDVSKIDINIDDSKIQLWEFENHTWEAMVSKEDKSILLKDISYSSYLKDIIENSQLCVLSLYISYSKKLDFDDAKKSEVSLKIEQILQEWSNKVNGVFNQLKSIENTSSISFRWKDGEKEIIDEIFFNKLKSSISNFLNDVTISIGVSFGKDSLLELRGKSLKVLEISKNRGGDQVVIEHSSGKIEYLGSSSIQNQSNTSQTLKTFYTKLVEDIKTSREVFITSHKLADLDSLGSVLGVYELVKKNGKTPYIILNEFGDTSQELYDKLPKSIKSKFITEIKAHKIFSNRTSIIITDTSIPSSTQLPNLIRKAKSEKILIIDHHRVGKDTFKSLEEGKTLIDPSASSTSELVVEMLKLSVNKGQFLITDPFISTSMLAGIKLDTKRFTKNTSNLTHDAVSFLLNNEADTTLVDELFLFPINLLSIKSESLRNLKILKTKILFTSIPKKNIISDEIVSILADDLLNYKKVEASFVLAKTKNNTYKLSIRSKGNINVQLIAESLGGGGHFNSAAASWSTLIDYDNIIKKITKQINGDIK